MPYVKTKKLHPDAKLPAQGTEYAGCFDLYAVEDTTLCVGEPRKKIRTGLAFEVPAGYCMRVYPRSSSFLKGLEIGSLVVDADYRGEVFVMAGYQPAVKQTMLYEIKKGDRIAQVKLQRVEPTTFEWAETLSETKRGEGGYGSTGR